MNQKAHKKDIDLTDKLKEEIPYIILYAVGNLKLAYDRGDLLESPNSKRLVQQLRRESDNVMAFLAECVSIVPGNRFKKKDVYDSYKAYCTYMSDPNPVGVREFYVTALERGLIERKHHGYDCFVDIEVTLPQ